MVTQTIPISKIVNMSPGVVAPAGSAIDLTGLVLTKSTRPPIGDVVSFGSAAAVSDYFGGTSDEYIYAQSYFQAPDDSTIAPGALLIAQYNDTAVSGYVRGGPGVTLARVQLITSGTLAVTVDGTLKTSSALNLSTATSLSNAATLIQAAFTSPGFTVTYDSQAAAFVVTSSTTGATSTIAITSGTNAQALKLQASTGAVTSPGAAAVTSQSDYMDGILQITQAWASFSTIFEPSSADGLAFADWTSAQNSRYCFVAWDTDVNNALPSPVNTLKVLIDAAGDASCLVIYSPVNTYKTAAFVQGYFASLEFTRLNGRKTLDFRSQAGLPADVTSQTAYDNLIANGLNFYGSYASANSQFIFMTPGSITGKFLWADSFANQIWLNANLQLALITLMTAANSIPFNAAGDALVEAACADPIQAAVNFGAIRSGVTLSQSQKQAVNSAAGVQIDQILTTRGWYLQPGVSTASPAVRAARGPVSSTLWYTDGQSVQSINFTSLEVI